MRPSHGHSYSEGSRFSTLICKFSTLWSMRALRRSSNCPFFCDILPDPGKLSCPATIWESTWIFMVGASIILPALHTPKAPNICCPCTRHCSPMIFSLLPLFLWSRPAATPWDWGAPFLVFHKEFHELYHGYGNWPSEIIPDIEHWCLIETQRFRLPRNCISCIWRSSLSCPWSGYDGNNRAGRWCPSIRRSSWIRHWKEMEIINMTRQISYADFGQFSVGVYTVECV